MYPRDARKLKFFIFIKQKITVKYAHDMKIAQNSIKRFELVKK